MPTTTTAPAAPRTTYPADRLTRMAPAMLAMLVRIAADPGIYAIPATIRLDLYATIALAGGRLPQ